MGMTVLVENKAGGNFIPARKEVLTLATRRPHALFHLDELADHPGAASGLSVRPAEIRRRSPRSSTGPLILVVKNDLGVKSVKELIALAKQKPGTLKFGAGGGTGSSLGFATALLQDHGRTSRSPSCPIAAPGPALNDLLGGHIDAMFDAMPVMSIAGQGRQSDAARGHRHQALGGAARRADHAGVRLPDLRRSPAGTASWRRPARRPPSCRSCATRPRRRWRRRTWSRRWPRRAWSRAARQPAEFAKYLASELAFYKKIVKDANLKPE